MSKNETRVVCKVCHKSFPVLYTHLDRSHNLSKSEYLKRFPNAKLHSESYIQKISDTSKKRFIDDPTLRQKVANRTFGFIKNKKLTPLLQRDYKSARTCLVNSLWKPSIILYASIIEAILIEENPTAKDFNGALEIAFSNKYLSKNEYYKIHIVRDLRNFVHLHKELSEGEEIDEYWAKAFADICESLIKRLSK